MKRLVLVVIIFAMAFFYSFGGTGECGTITNITLSPSSPASLEFEERVNISFNYMTDHAAGVRIFARPFTKGSPTPNISAHSSPIYPAGSGSGEASFTVKSGVTKVDQVRFKMLSADQNRLLFEYFMDVLYRYLPSFGGGGSEGCFIDSLQDENNEPPFN